MRSVSYRLADLIKARIPLGFVGENEHTVVQFDAKQAFDQYPTATPSLTVKNPSGEKYPAVVVRDGDMVIWTISDSDLIVPGRGEFQLQFKEGDTVMRSYVGETRIERSIMPTGDVPTPVQNWIDAAEDVLEEVEEAIPAGGTTGQVLAKKSDADRDTEWVDQTGGGGGGTTNYNALSNKPQIGGVTLSGNKTLHELGAAAESDIPDVSGLYTKPSGGIPKTDLASGVQTSLGKADTAYQKPGSGIPASDIADGVIPDVSGFYTKPQTGIPASDLASGVIPDVSGFYTKPSGGIPSSDMASAVKTSLGKADTAYQKPGSGIPASDIASGVIPDVSGFYTKPVTGIPASDLASGVIPTVHNVPAGGSANQVLAKNSGTDYDLKWVNQSGGGGGAEIDDTAGEGDTDVVWSADKTWTETEALKEAIANLTEEETATLTNAVSINSLPAYSGMKKIGVTDGVATFKTSDSPSTSPALRDLCYLGTGDWVVSFKYKLTKNNQQLGDFNHVKVYTGNSEIHYYPAVYDEWVYVQIFTKENLTRVYIMLDSFASAPAEDDLTLQIKDYYVYDIADVHGGVLFNAIDSQRKNFTDGQVTYTAENIKGIPVNAKDYGAKGDGETDDTDVINAILRSFDGQIYFPAGTYLISGTVEVWNPNTVMYGNGDQTVFSVYDNTSLYYIHIRIGNCYPYILVRNDNIEVRNIKVVGNTDYVDYLHWGVGIFEADNIRVSGVTVSDVNCDFSTDVDDVLGYGIAAVESNFVTIENCYVKNCGYECVGFFDDCNYGVIQNNYTQDGKRTCIQVHRGCKDIIVKGNYMKQTNEQYSACVTVHGLNDGHVIYRLRIEDNTMIETETPVRTQTYAAPAQLMSYTEGLWFINNHITGTKRALFAEENITDLVIMGNNMTCDDTSDYGITVRSAARIIGNYLDNDASTPSNTISSSAIVFGNIGIGDTILNGSGVSF